MLGLLYSLTNLEEVACTVTGVQQNRYVPAAVLYRTAIAGAMLHAKLFGDGECYAEYHNAFLNDPVTGETMRVAYTRLLERLPPVAVTDAVLCCESQIRREVFNVIYDGTATALGSLKNSAVRGELPQNRLVRRRNGSLVLGKASPLQAGTGLTALDFSALRSDPKQGHPLPSIREVMTARIGAQAHLFRVSGARWEVALLAGDGNRLSSADTLLKVVFQDLGVGAKHSFRGKGVLSEPHLLRLQPIEQQIAGSLFQPLICRDGDISATLERLGIQMTLNMSISMRTDGFGPQARVVPAVSGEVIARQGYLAEWNGRRLIFTEEDLAWPRQVADPSP